MTHLVIGNFASPRLSINVLYSLERKIVETTAKIENMEWDKETKEDLKTVSLGTSKINYLDPRITVAWCKQHEVPIEKVNHSANASLFLFLFLFLNLETRWSWLLVIITMACRFSTSRFWQSLLGQWTWSELQILKVFSSYQNWTLPSALRFPLVNDLL